MTVTNATATNPSQFVKIPNGNSGDAGAGDKAQPAAGSANAKPATVVDTILAARAQYLKTGIDKDAAIGDPDHDAPKKAPAPSSTSSTSVNITA